VSSDEIKDLIETVKQQIDTPGDQADIHSPDVDSAEGDDSAELLSGVDFQSVLDKSLGSDESLPPDSVQEEQADRMPDTGDSSMQDQPDEPPAEPEQETRKTVVPYGEKQAGSDEGASRPDISDINSIVDPVGFSRKKSSASDRLPLFKTARQILGVLLLVFLSIVFFRIFGPERRQPTVEELFRPGNPDIEFLDALEQIEKYYDSRRKKMSAAPGTDSLGEEDFEQSPSSQPASNGNTVNLDDSADNSTPRNSDRTPAARDALP
jgi:hypothetical protein